jgi:hypothetical protein
VCAWQLYLVKTRPSRNPGIVEGIVPEKGEAPQKKKTKPLFTGGWVELLFLTNMNKSAKIRWAGHVA